MRPMATVLSIMLSFDVLAGCNAPGDADGVSAGQPPAASSAVPAEATPPEAEASQALAAAPTRVRHAGPHRRVRHRHASPR